MRHERSQVVLRCQNIFRFGVASGEVSLANAFHISAWLAPQPLGKRSNDERNFLVLGHLWFSLSAAGGRQMYPGLPMVFV
jgi:hypothetical protein